jgi:hypothetical protein
MQNAIRSRAPENVLAKICRIDIIKGKIESIAFRQERGNEGF